MKSSEQMGRMLEQTEIGLKKDEAKITELDFSGLEIGDKITTKTVSEAGGGDYEITVVGKRKNGLLVSVKSGSGEKRREFIARMPGGFLMGEKGGLTAGVLKITDEESKGCLYFENLKNSATKERESSKMRTTPILELSVEKKEEK